VTTSTSTLSTEQSTEPPPLNPTRNSLQLEVGTIAKAHGLKGEVVLRLISDRPERLAPGSVLSSRKGPLTVVSAARFQDRWRVRFAGYDDRTAAESLHGLVLSADALPPGSDDELWVHELIGAAVFGIDGTDYGTIAAIEANPAADLLVLNDGQMVPVVFVVEHVDGRVTIDPPVGLLDED
jgi:16S rRNA processing protein RimM